MLKKYAILIILILFITFSSNVMAQGIPCPNPGPGPCNPPGAPIDGGIGLLLVIGIGYAVSKLRKDKK
ncbi:MAG: hypothetical protein L3J20_09745 [Flavobacteriaceae bacterium]|nr:hypothetical protein [Flavobacteriaceae bacterium]